MVRMGSGWRDKDTPTPAAFDVDTTVAAGLVMDIAGGYTLIIPVAQGNRDEKGCKGASVLVPRRACVCVCVCVSGASCCLHACGECRLKLRSPFREWPLRPRVKVSPALAPPLGV